MAKNLQLQVPEPCHENWDKMTPVDKGRYCDSCQKAVVDFTGMSDAQLVAFFKKPSTGSLCGRFNNEQLERDIAFPKKRIPWFKYLLQICLPVFIANTKAVAQGKPYVKMGETTQTCIKPDSNINGIVLGLMTSPPIKNRLQGRVVDENSNAIPYASVFIKDSKKGVTCDAQGYFSIRVNPKDKFVTLVTSSVGYETNEKNFSNNAGSVNEIVLKTEPKILTDVVVTSMGLTKKGMIMGYSLIMVRKDSLLNKVKNFFINDSMKVYPNPAKSGSTIKIGIKNGEAEEMQIELLNLQGQVIRSSVINTYEKNPIITYQLPNIISGSYLLRLKNKKSGKTQTEKIIVQ